MGESVKQGHMRECYAGSQSGIGVLMYAGLHVRCDYAIIMGHDSSILYAGLHVRGGVSGNI